MFYSKRYILISNMKNRYKFLISFSLIFMILMLHIRCRIKTVKEEFAYIKSPKVSANFRIIKTKFPFSDTVVAAYTVKEFNAKGDAKTDDTQAFQKALYAAKAQGGGVVFAPSGKYAIKGNLYIPTGVTLRGEWQKPEKGRPLRGTILLCYSGRGDKDGQPFITIKQSGGIKNIAIFYPLQNADKITPYPWCIQQDRSDNATVENVTLVNPYQGIRIGPRYNELHYIHNVYGTPLYVGMEIDVTTDIGRIENLYFNSDIWADSGLSGSDISKSKYQAWMKKKGTGIRMYRSDWEYGFNINIKGYNTGLEILGSKRGYPNAQFYRVNISDCIYGLNVKGSNPFGIVFTASTFEGKKTAIHLGEEFYSVVMFHTCRISGTTAVEKHGQGHISFLNCEIKKGPIKINNGSFSIVNSKFKKGSSLLELGKEVVDGKLINNKFESYLKIKNNSQLKDIKNQKVNYSFPSLPKCRYKADIVKKPARDKLYVVTDPPFNADRTGEKDTTRSIQSALDRAGKEGGGIVFLPGGIYRLYNRLVVPSGVELRGVDDVPHHTKVTGSVLFIYSGKGKKSETGCITLKEKSGIRGLSFHYPEQDYKNPIAYPFLLQGKGKGIYMINISASNPFQYVDLASYRCDSHYLNYICGAPLLAGIIVGKGSRNGRIYNTQFNPHYWMRAPYPGSPSKGEIKGEGRYLWNYQKENLDAMVFKDCSGEVAFQNFVYGSLYGIRLTGEKGPDGYIHGHGTDGSKVSAFIEAVGNKGMDFVNTQLVCMSSLDKVYFKVEIKKSRKITFFNTMLWGRPDESGFIKSGILNLQQANFFKKGRRGFIINGGALELVNCYFWKTGRNLEERRIQKPSVLIGNFIRKYQEDEEE